MAKVYSDGDCNTPGRLIGEVCSKCYDEMATVGKTDEEIVAAIDGNGEDRFSFGVYAGHYCDRHWKSSGYKGSTPETADEEFDPDYAGERMEEDY